MHSSTDVDELIETEVCNRLISLSCAKMVNSKNERGGAKLRRNLLILHLLRRARSEQNRPPVVVPDVMSLPPQETCPQTPSVAFSPPILHCPDGSGMYCQTGGQVLYETGMGSYYDYVNSESMKNDCNCDPVVDMLANSSNNSAVMSDEYFQLQFKNEEMQLEVKLGGERPENSGFPMMVSAPMPLECSMYGNEQCDYSAEQSSSYDNDEDDEGFDPCTSRQRKRKTSMSQSCTSTTAKKCCVEERQFTGLMSVFNSGLSVVADHLIPRTPAGTLLPPPSDQLVPLVRIPCNPLIC